MAFTKRGMRLLKALENLTKEKPAFFDTKNIFNKITFIAANDDHMKATFKVDASMCNCYNIMHGGYMVSVMDIMCVYAYVARREGKIAFTTSINVNYVGLAVVGDNIIAEAKTIKAGNHPILESVLYKENGTLVAIGTLCFKNGNEENQRLTATTFGFDARKTDD